ncbi:hypothetical protein BJ138DRAFT_330004 [Hygrophoropsis aurantiaca]|uniref:Uncharacterized protein n=1 Tax=Hygrophoropsis aurantiaca TaxID=72124 RepID=A0ACB8A6I1_9AGAM|nr:hypothetical protein BJ138DRAFT_330004 [Hygrophoropsis aurantiaca]
MTSLYILTAVSPDLCRHQMGLIKDWAHRIHRLECPTLKVAETQVQTAWHQFIDYEFCDGLKSRNHSVCTAPCCMCSYGIRFALHIDGCMLLETKRWHPGCWRTKTGSTEDRTHDRNAQPGNTECSRDSSMGHCNRKTYNSFSFTTTDLFMQFFILGTLIHTIYM